MCGKCTNRRIRYKRRNHAVLYQRQPQLKRQHKHKHLRIHQHQVILHTPTQTPSNTETPTQTQTPTNTGTPTQTPSNTATPTQTPTTTQTQTPTNTASPTVSESPRRNPDSISPTPTASVTQTPSDTPGTTATPTPTVSNTPTNYDCFISGGTSPLYKYTDVAMSRDSTVSSTTDGKFQLVTVFSGFTFQSTNSGDTWNRVNSIPSGIWRAASINGTGQYQYVVGGFVSGGSLIGPGGVFRSSDSGTTFQKMDYFPNFPYTDVAVSENGQYVTVISQSFEIVQYTPGGYNYYAVSGGTIYRSSNYGVTFSAATYSGSGSNSNYLTVSMSKTGQYQTIGSGLFGEIGDVSGRILTSSDYGVTWITKLEDI